MTRKNPDPLKSIFDAISEFLSEKHAGNTREVGSVKNVSLLLQQSRKLESGCGTRYRDLNKAHEEKFAGKLKDLTGKDEERLKLLEAIEKEQSEQPEEEEESLE